MVGVIFTKISRPKKRAATILWGHKAVICQRDGVMSMLFRVGDMRRTHIVEAHVRGVLVQRHVTQEGEVIDMQQTELDFGFDTGRDRVFLIWPMELQHKITPESPFWSMGPNDFSADNATFEVFIFFEGIVEATGMTTQARCSYTPGEILWGHRFEQLVTYESQGHEYLVDLDKFHSTRCIDDDDCADEDDVRFPQVSARRLHRIRNKRKESDRQFKKQRRKSSLAATTTAAAAAAAMTTTSGDNAANE